MEAGGVEVVHEWAECMVHVYPLLWPHLGRRADEGLALVARLLRECIQAGAAS
jgi:hypothetical protein